MSQETQIKYNEKGNFFELSDGLKLPAVGTHSRFLCLYPDFVHLQFLYSIKKNNFIDGVVLDYNNDDSEEDYPCNKEIVYKLLPGEYVMFGVKAMKNVYIDIYAFKFEFYVEDPNELLQNEEKIKYRLVDEAGTVIYYSQIKELTRLSDVTKLLIDMANNVMKQIEENGSYELQIPRLVTSNKYTWRDIKQMILDLRQPLDLDA
ncbi:MAG: hypothetical protein QXW71_06510 [Thermoplasmata archaeon]